MKDPGRRTPEAERVQDLEVRDDEAREIAGGKMKHKAAPRKKALGRMHAERVNERRQT